MASLDRALAIDPYYVPAILMKADLLERTERLAGSPSDLSRDRRYRPEPRQPSRAGARGARARARADQGRRRSARRRAGASARRGLRRLSGRGFRRARAYAEQRTGQPQSLCAAADQRPFPLSARDRIFRPRAFPLVRRARSEDSRDQAGAAGRCSNEEAGASALMSPSMRPSRSINGPSSTTPALERILLLGGWRTAGRELRPLPGDGGGARRAAVARPSRQGAHGFVLDPGAAHPNPAPHRIEQRPRHRSSSPCRAGRVRLAVGSQARTFQAGTAWAFDDTIEHEAWNDSDEPRAILILDVWNPLLSEAERAAVRVVG